MPLRGLGFSCAGVGRPGGPALPFLILAWAVHGRESAGPAVMPYLY